MNITPLDILQHRFGKKLLGVDGVEVKEFLEMVASQLEEMIKENNYLAEELKKKNSTIGNYRERENTIKETMITAQKVTEDMKQNVRKEAEIIVSGAELEAEKIVIRSHERVVKLAEEISELKRQRMKFESELRGLLGTHMKLLDAAAEVESEIAETEEKVRYLSRNTRSDE